MSGETLVIAVLTGGIGSAIVSGIFPLVKWLLERRAHKEDKAEAKEEKTTDIQNDINEIKKALEATQEAVERLKETAEDLRTADRYVLKERIELLANKYLDRGNITSKELEKLIEMHGVYHTILKGNGFLDSLMAKVKALPVRNAKKEGEDGNKL